MTIDVTDYNTLCDNVAADLAFVEEHAHGAVKARTLQLHSRLLWARGVMDAELGVVRPAEGGDKPPPNGP